MRQPQIFFVILFLFYALAPRHVGMGQASRIDLTQAIVEDQTFRINKYVHNTIDWSKFEDNYFTNKAPGVSILAVPFYWLMTQLQHAVDAPADVWWFRKLRWADIFVTALPSALLAWLLYMTLMAWTSNPNQALFLTFTYALGTLAFPFSTMMWAHQTVASFLFAGFYFLVVHPRYFLAGTFIGLSVLTEYTSALALPAFAYLWFKGAGNKQKSAIQIALGGLPWLVFFMYYHKACFGGYFALAPRFQNPSFNENATESFKVLQIFSLPQAPIVMQLLIGTERGLFLISPFLLFIFSGFRNWFRLKTLRSEFWFSISFPLALLLLNSSYNGWHGGGSSGPRYLIPCLPFLILSLAFIKPSIFFNVLCGISVLLAALITSIDTMAPAGENLFFYLLNKGLQNPHKNIFIVAALSFSLWGLILKRFYK